MGMMIFLVITLLFLPSGLWAQDQAPGGKKEETNKDTIYVVVKDAKGEETSGFLHFNSDELSIISTNKEEKSVPVKYIQSITLEKVRDLAPGEEYAKKGYAYSVRLENSKEIYTLGKKYTFNLNTSVGVVTKTIDPETVANGFSRDLAEAKVDSAKSFFRDKSVIFSLQFKF